MASVACLTGPYISDTKGQRAMFRFVSVSLNLSKRRFLLLIFTTDLYGDVCMGASSVRRWVKHFKDGNTSIQDHPRSGRHRTASTEPNKKSAEKSLRKTDV